MERLRGQPRIRDASSAPLSLVIPIIAPRRGSLGTAIEPINSEKSAEIIRAFDAHGAGIDSFLDRAPTLHEWKRYRDSTVDERTPARGSARYLEITMNHGGPPQLLPIISPDDLINVLLQAMVPLERWPRGSVDALYRELSCMDTLLFSRRVETHSGTEDPENGARALGSKPPARTNCPHLLLKRKMVVVQLLNEEGDLEVVGSSSGESIRGAAASRVQYFRLTAPLNKADNPMSIAIDAACRTHGLPNTSVLPMMDDNGLGAEQIIVKAPQTSDAYPSLQCEDTLYVVRLRAVGLPRQPAFCTQHTKWVWTRPQAPDAVTWSGHRTGIADVKDHEFLLPHRSSVSMSTTPRSTIETNKAEIMRRALHQVR